MQSTLKSNLQPDFWPWANNMMFSVGLLGLVACPTEILRGLNEIMNVMPVTTKTTTTIYLTFTKHYSPTFLHLIAWTMASVTVWILCGGASCPLHFTAPTPIPNPPPHCLVPHMACRWGGMFKMQMWSDQCTLKPFKDSPLLLGHVLGVSACHGPCLPSLFKVTLPIAPITQASCLSWEFWYVSGWASPSPALWDPYSGQSFCSEVFPCSLLVITYFFSELFSSGASLFNSSLSPQPGLILLSPTLTGPYISPSKHSAQL